MNTYILISILLAIAGAFAGGEFDGRHRGADQQVVADQAKFDRMNLALAKQKDEANALLEKAQADIITAQAAADDFKTQLEKESAARKTDNDRLRGSYAGRSLQYASKAPRCGAGGSDANGAQGAAASPDAAAVVQLPDTITRDLRQLTFEADTLKSEYQKCFDWVRR